MVKSYEHIKRMRGETSKPLVDELKRIIQHDRDNGGRLITVQVDSGLVSKGLSLFFRTSGTPTAWVCLARNEIPGFIPLTLVARLNGIGWQVEKDEFETEFAWVSKEISSMDPAEQAAELAAGLELLGAPQKYTWELKPEYF